MEGRSSGNDVFSQKVGISKSANTRGMEIAGYGSSVGVAFVWGSTNGTGFLCLSNNQLPSDWLSEGAAITLSGSPGLESFGLNTGDPGVVFSGGHPDGAGLVLAGQGARAALQMSSTAFDCVVVHAAVTFHDVNLTGSGDILGNLAGYIKSA